MLDSIKKKRERERQKLLIIGRIKKSVRFISKAVSSSLACILMYFLRCGVGSAEAEVGWGPTAS